MGEHDHHDDIGRFSTWIDQEERPAGIVACKVYLHHEQKIEQPLGDWDGFIHDTTGNLTEWSHNKPSIWVL